jgi:hypothetical protein
MDWCSHARAEADPSRRAMSKHEPTKSGTSEMLSAGDVPSHAWDLGEGESEPQGVAREDRANAFP